MVFDQRAFRAFSWKLLTDFTAEDMMWEYLVVQPCLQQASGWILWPLHENCTQGQLCFILLHLQVVFLFPQTVRCR